MTKIPLGTKNMPVSSLDSGNFLYFELMISDWQR